MIIVQTLHWIEFAGTEKICVDLCNEFSKEHEGYLLSSKKIKPYLDNNVKFDKECCLDKNVVHSDYVFPPERYTGIHGIDVYDKTFEKIKRYFFASEVRMAAYNLKNKQFSVVEGNIFPTIELHARLARLRANKEFDLLGTNGTLVEEKGVVSFKADMENKLEPINEYPVKPKRKDREGCIIQFESPREINGKVPDGAYIISIDTIRQDGDGGQSLIAIYVLKTKKHAFEIGHDEIVMSYVGRPKYNPIDTSNFILYKMGKYYNAKITHENDAAGKSVRDFFVKNKAFHMLMKPPSNIVDKHISNSKTNQRKSGHSMGSIELVEIGELYTNQWLMEKRGINPHTGLEERNLDLLADKGLLEELIAYNRDRNTDRVSALMGAIIQSKNVFNEYAKKEKESNKVTTWFAERMNPTYKR